MLLWCTSDHDASASRLCSPSMRRRKHSHEAGSCCHHPDCLDCYPHPHPHPAPHPTDTCAPCSALPPLRPAPPVMTTGLW
jgi:hypothetical protein